MEAGRGWLFRAVDRGWMKAESLIDGTVDLEFIELVHEALDVSEENQRRVDEWRRNG